MISYLLSKINPTNLRGEMERRERRSIWMRLTPNLCEIHRRVLVQMNEKINPWLTKIKSQFPRRKIEEKKKEDQQEKKN